ncbi:LysR family transcriptional regulator [Streptomyces virginiae]|uniref:LysR family transcriptional regulator n=1 Tax=Streptomyces virginiae TaxID=1961 RepID=UPI0022545ACB|nr:LysR family transcriptional regulator [Streptomyces virginiae]MCX4956895.1 LysR family transcriptional regulator [Streptomyces virginiae]
MELRQLAYFVAVAEKQNFTRAAERVHISQSGISAQIRQLERELGAELFDRSARTATLTAAGAAALAPARAALAAAAAVGQAVGDVAGVIRGRITVGMVVGCTVTPLFEALAAFHRAHPGVEIALLEDNSDRLVQGVRAGTVDVALIGTATAAPAGLEALTLVSERLVVAVPPDHPLAHRRRVTLRDLADHPVICMPAGTGLRTVLDQACAAQRLQPVIALQAGAADAMADLAARGLGVAVLSESMAESYRDRLSARVIDDVDIPALLCLVWRAAHGPAVRELLAYGRRAFGGGGLPEPAAAGDDPGDSRAAPPEEQ